MSVDMYPTEPDFDFIPSNHERFMVSSAYQVVSNMEKWDYLHRFDPGDSGFMLTKDTIAVEIMDNVERAYQGNSGCSMGCTMRVIQAIAQVGYRRYRKKYLNEPDDETDFQPTIVEQESPETITECDEPVTDTSHDSDVALAMSANITLPVTTVIDILENKNTNKREIIKNYNKNTELKFSIPGKQT